MADTTATGYCGTAIEAMRWAFAYSTSFKTATGAATTTAAQSGYTFTNWYTGTPTKPFIVVQNGAISRSKYGTTTWQQEQTVIVRFEYPYSDPHANAQAAITALYNLVMAVMANVEAVVNSTITVSEGTTKTIPEVMSWRIQEEEGGARFSAPG